jgi:predicted metal-dependent HD superfamily phosphohydrolase
VRPDNTCCPGRPGFQGAEDALDDLLAAVPVPDAARADLRRRMAAPGRRYHGLEHIALLWTRHLALGRGSGFHEPRVARLVASAIAFHDAVLEPGHAGNERASAALWRKAAAAAARGGAMLAEEVEWVAGTIEATADHLAAAEAVLAGGGPAAAPLLACARVWVLDLDLSPLGEAPAAFARNAGLLRLERPDLDDSAWRQQVLAFLARLHAAPRLYRTPVVQAAFEARARANIARAISKLRAA